MKTPQALVGMNETASILFLLILSAWFFTNKRFQSLLAVIKAPITAASTSSNTIADSPYISDADKAASKGQSGIIGVTPDGRVPGMLVPALDPKKNA